MLRFLPPLHSSDDELVAGRSAFKKPGSKTPGVSPSAGRHLQALASSRSAGAAAERLEANA
jgi:hypothetical protein